MNISQGLKMAVKSIIGNKLRSLLTMLGIIIGVTAVIALVSIGQGATKSVSDQVQSLGTNLLSVNILGRGSRTTLTYDQAMEFADLDGVEYAAPISNQNASLKYGTNSESTSVVGTNSDYANIKDYEVASGRFLGSLDILYNQKIVILGSTTAENLFGPFDDPVGKSVEINGNRFKVVGLLKEKGSSLGGSNDEVAIIPLTTAERVFRSKGVRSVNIQVATADRMDQVTAELEKKLNGIFRNNTDSYQIFNQQDLLETMSAISNSLSVALGGIAGISLLVGGIGIMNIMLVSVSERTREIGIRKAIGAKKRDILVQFLIESIALSGFGGVLGVGLGIGASRMATSLFQMETVISVGVVALAFSFSVAIGVVFGLFPANRAAKLKPIDALRFD